MPIIGRDELRFCFFKRPEDVSFDRCFVSLPVVGLLVPGSPAKLFGGFLESKDTCEAFDFCLLAAFAICFFVFSLSPIFFYYFSPLVHVKSV